MPVNSVRFNRLIILLSASILIIVNTGMARAAAQANAKTFIVIGSEVINKGNVPAARDKAIAESLVTALALMTENILEKDNLVQNFQQLNEFVYNQPDKFIEGYKVLSEATAGKNYRVVVEATVSENKVTKELTKTGILRVKTDMPSVLILIAENNIDDMNPRFWWSLQEKNFESISQQSLAELLQEKGFNIIDPQGSRQKKSVDWGSFNKAELTDEEAINLGGQLGAQVIVLGNSSASPTPNTMGTDMKSFKGTVTARALRTDSGEEIASLSRTTVAANTDEVTGGNEALSTAGTLTAESLAQIIADVWQKKAQQPNLVEIAIEGTKKLTNFVRFRRILSSIPGVQGVRVKEMKTNEATLYVDYKGTAEDLASALMLKSFESFGINITEVDQNNMRIALIPG